MLILYLVWSIMSSSITLLMAQINPTVGALAHNTQQIISIITAHQATHDLIIFPELALTGYPPEDLLLREAFLQEMTPYLHQIRTVSTRCHVIVGHPSEEKGLLYNAASVFAKGKCIALYHKQHLPNDGVFDERRYFQPGAQSPCLFPLKHYQLGLGICEDFWQPGPGEQLIAAGADLIISINASPFDEQKYTRREQVMKTYANQCLGLIYTNLVGGQDELVFDGQSMALDGQGAVVARAPAFQEGVASVTIKDKRLTGIITPLLSAEALLYQALLRGLTDYIEKNGFPGVLLGLSGGIDSALTLALAVDALGKDRVHAVLLPSRYTAPMSLEDALFQANTLAVRHTTLSIEPLFETFLTTLKPAFHGAPTDTTEENIQARIRGTLLMALSNKSGDLLLTTSNKSETAVGYSTLYGDMAGGFAVLKDVLKTTVYALARYRNTCSPIIPERVLTRAPSAELAPHQTDQDSLPDYAILDAIITHYMVDRLSAEDIIPMGFIKEDVQKTIQLIQRNEYKRRQAAPGVKITPCAFGRDWRYPLTHAQASCKIPSTR